MMNDKKNQAISALDYKFLDMRYPCVVYYENKSYPSAENAYQAACCSDPKTREKFRYMTPDKAAYMGARMKKNILSKPMDQETILKAVLLSKFSDSALKKALLQTGSENIILENIRHENVLGTCSCPKCRNKGRNAAGVILTSLRSELFAVAAH